MHDHLFDIPKVVVFVAPARCKEIIRGMIAIMGQNRNYLHMAMFGVALQVESFHRYWQPVEYGRQPLVNSQS